MSVVISKVSLMVLDVIFAVITFVHLESSMSALVGWPTGYLENTFA